MPSIPLFGFDFLSIPSLQIRLILVCCFACGRVVCVTGLRWPSEQTDLTQFDNLTLVAFGTHMAKVALTKEQLAELKEIFVRFDRDGDGSLTELEIGALMRSLGLQPNAEQIAAFIQRADKNSNGLIEFPEFVALIGSDSTEEISYNQDELLALFRKFDRDGNGYITAAELAHSMAKMGHALSVRELTDMIREADTDGDGRISFAEFCAAMTNAASEYMSPHLR